MAANTDHLRRDAESAARAEISVMLSKYQRRLYEEAKTHIGRAIAEARAGDELDGTSLGRSAFAAAAASWVGSVSGDPQPAIEVGEDRAPEE